MKHYRVGIDNSIPTGLMVGAAPDQTVYLHRFGAVAPPMPDNTVIWAHETTVKALTTNAINLGQAPIRQH